MITSKLLATSSNSKGNNSFSQIEKWSYDLNSMQRLLRVHNYSMTLSPHKQHKIYVAAIMGYGLGSENPKELAYYNMVKKKVKQDKKSGNMGIQRTD